LLTLLAVPVFYELFEEFQEAPFWRRLAARSSRFSSRIGRAGSRIGSRLAGGSKAAVFLLAALAAAGPAFSQAPQAAPTVSYVPRASASSARRPSPWSKR
jgi:hypothetical protein